MGAKKFSQKIFNYRLKNRTTKSPIVYAASFVAIFLFLSAENFFSNPSQPSIDLTLGYESGEKLEEVLQTDEEIESTAVVDSDIPQVSMQENLEMTDTNGDDTDNHDHLVLSDETNLVNSDIPQLSVQENHEEETDTDTDDKDDLDPLIPPEHLTRDERIAWFRRQLPELEILHSSSLSQQFHNRVSDFLSTGCSVLFHITWFSTAKTFGERDFLTMDTIFKSHPQGCVLIVSRSMDSKRGTMILKPLLHHGFKVLAVTPDLPFLVKDTPAQTWLEEMNSGTKDPGHIPLFMNLSNLIRLAMLYKYGGVYVDTDLVILKDFSQLRNAIGAQSVDSVTKKWTRLNGAILIFDKNHPILLDFLQEFASTFDGNKWGHNGPYLVSRVIERVGNTPGYNLTILPPRAFYPVDWFKIGKLFKKPQNESELSWVERKVDELTEGDTYAVHLWNKRSKDLDIEDGSVMAKLVLDHCVVCDNITKS